MESEKQIFNDITPQEARKLINENLNNPNFLLLDVRTPDEFFSAHIEGSKNLDYHGINFNNELNKLDKNKKYLLYCRSGVRSANVFNLMRSAGFNKIYNMLGGITLWADEGFPLVR
ncbi:rhodanese-like domain-containing protein [Methanobacterium alcaliphilum]|uniref:rhodanese-like domain-containing protein n=1 Tax=Methanobacterium alcaliphilum TaxID=392018 RepID=UPI00200B3270|nr:rhodanese-like domain-containing protein [Methanobacterium alcaliphilum]MCK9150850.1 rhodanese-like domain-containing protein [Methanobacterium alcaliphilum]